MDKVYYQEMLEKGRLIPFILKGRLVCFITFYICNDETRYVNTNPWKVLEDNPQGKICYISQLLTDKNSDNPKISYEIWSRFKIYIQNSFPSVEYISWRRWNKLNEAVKTYKKEI